MKHFLVTKIRLRENFTSEIFTGENIPIYGMFLCVCSESILKSAESHQQSIDDKFQYGPLTERLIAVSQLVTGLSVQLHVANKINTVSI